MHQTNIETLRDEAQRQLHLLKELLQKAQKKGLVDAPAKNERDRATFDTESLPKALEVLDGESHKLNNLEMVLAVVGTMKAGKSTSINAIVGAEVLPNRNRPMTALPTLIRHTPGVLQPRLMFEKVKPLNDLLDALSQAVSKTQPETLKELVSDADMAELLAQIQRQTPFASRHDGEQGIFQFLKGLNDLVRLCFALEVEFPFAEYATVDAMPVIEVEFSHLKNTPATQGRLTLLDTPGPNEAGQQHLRHMLKDQLKKASAVLAVLDYTQLKSDADAQVRENLLEISETAKGRIYALINKFDQKDRNSDDAETVKKYVSQSLMRGSINEDCVFPVSSLRGYLASRSRNEIERHGKLPIGEPWVEDFGSLALGVDWDKQAAENTERMKKAADGFWEKSGFAAPLKKVIIEAHQNAALESLRSAASKLENIARDAGNFFKANVGALKKSAAELGKNINSLQHDIDNIIEIENDTEVTLKRALENMRSQVKGAANEVQKEVNKEVATYFKEGKRIEKVFQSKKNSENKRKKTKNENSLDSESKGFIASMASVLNNSSFNADQENQDFDPSSLIIKFDSISEANDFKDKVEKSIRNVMSKAEIDLKSCIQNGIIDFSKEFDKSRFFSLEKIKKSAQNSIEEFDIEIKIPDVRSIDLEIPVHSIFEDAVEEKTKPVKRSRRKSGAWGTVCRWFNTDDWGWEDYQTTEEYFQVDLQKISISSNDGIKILFESANSVLDREIYPKLQQGVESFFGVFRENIEHIRGDLMSGIQKHSLDQEEKSEILEFSTKMAREASSLEKDCTALNKSAEELRRKEGVSFVKGEMIA